jgi:calcium-binding protein CML
VKEDGDGDGFIDLQEFISLYAGRASTASRGDAISRTPSKSGSDGASSNEKCALQAAFEVFDVDKNGFISTEELQRVMRSLGDKQTSLAKCRHMINCVDKDGANMIDFHEFQCLMSDTFVC